MQRIVRGFLGRCKALHWKHFLAAVAIQRTFRGKLGRQLVKDKRYFLKCTRSANKIMKRWKDNRVYRASLRILVGLRMERATVKIQRVWRGMKGRQHYSEVFTERLRDASALLIQTVFRGHLAVQKLKRARQRRDASIKIQSLIRQHQARTKVEIHRRRAKAARKIQTRVRIFLAKHTVYVIKHSPPALKIQRMWRGHCGRRKAHRRRDFLKRLKEKKDFAASLLQKTWRGYKSRWRYCFRVYRRRKRAAIVIQKTFRGRLGRIRMRAVRRQRALQKKNQAAIKMQVLVRGHFAYKILRDKKAQFRAHQRQRNLNARTIQRYWRGYRGRCAALAYRDLRIAQGWIPGKYGKYYLLKSFYERQQEKMVGREVRKAQAFARMILAKSVAARMKKKLALRVKQVKCAYKIQSQWKVHLAKNLLKKKRQEAEQKKLELDELRKQMELSAILLQARARGLIVRHKFALQVNSILLIQRLVYNFKRRRLQAEQRKIRQAELIAWAQERRRQGAATKIQTYVRGRQARIMVSAKLAKRRAQLKARREEGALIIQCAYRQYNARQRVQLKRLLASERQQEDDIERMVEERLPAYHRKQQMELHVVRIQSFFRKVRAYKKLDALRIKAEHRDEELEEERRNFAAKTIQTHTRGFLIRQWYNRNYDALLYQREKSRKCVECEFKYATRYCHTCQDKYCDSCWYIIHAHGNKQYHTFENARSAFYRYNDSTNDYNAYSDMYEMEGQMRNSPYNTFNSDAFAAGFATSSEFGDTYRQTSQDFFTDPAWTEQYDSTVGSNYWYNTETGEATWVHPSSA